MIGFRLERDFSIQPPTGGSCVGYPTDWWFPPKAAKREDLANLREARRICGECPVSKECLEYALETNEFYGVWGGMSWEQRKAERRRRQKEKSSNNVTV